jgi:hypothetical protein
MQFICQNISFKDNNKLLNYITYKIGNLKKYFYFYCLSQFAIITAEKYGIILTKI